MNNRVLTETRMEILEPIICESIRDGGQFVFYPSGISMYPTIKEKEDCVVLTQAKELVKNDLILYRRTGGAYVLHRIIKIKNGNYILCGDNQYVYEHGIKAPQIIAMASEIRKPDGKIIALSDIRNYRPCARLRIKRFFRGIRSLLGRVYRKAFKTR